MDKVFSVINIIVAIVCMLMGFHDVASRFVMFAMLWYIISKLEEQPPK